MSERYERARQRDEYGGINWGAAFFGWLVAIGLAALLTALLSAAGTAIAISEIENATGSDAETVGIVGGILLLAVMLIAYFAGGYVAGRMSRFDGARQGIGVWAWGLIVAVILAIVGAVAGSEWNLFGGLDLPRIPIDEGDLTTGGLILLAAVLIGTLLAAMAGGKAGERYHRKVDAVGYAAADERVEAEREDHARTSHTRVADNGVADGERTDPDRRESVVDRVRAQTRR